MSAPDQRTADLMQRLSDLQTWCVLMARFDSGGASAASLVQETRAFIVDRMFTGRPTIIGLDVSSRPDMTAKVTYAGDGAIENIEMDPKA